MYVKGVLYLYYISYYISPLCPHFSVIYRVESDKINQKVHKYKNFAGEIRGFPDALRWKPTDLAVRARLARISIFRIFRMGTSQIGKKV